MENTENYTHARRRAEAKYGFYVHVVVFVAVMTLLVVIDLMTSPGALWFYWPLAGWATAVVLHWAGAFVMGDRNTFVDALTERELRKG
jgi:hypothetical protein